MKYSIIIPVYNNAPDLQQCLASLKRQSYDHDLFEVIVVDNNSTDGSASIADAAGVRCLREIDFQSSYAARNLGIKNAQAEFIAFLDSDCVADKDWLSKIDARACDAAIGCFAGEILSVSPSTTVEQFSDDIGLLRQRGPLSGWHFKPYAQTANAVYRKAVFDSIGLFDPTMKSGGDAVLAWKMLDRTNYRIEFVPEAIVYHHHRISVAALWSQFRRYGGGKMSWALGQPNYQPPSTKRLEDDVIDLFDKLVADLESNGADTRSVIFPLLRSLTQVAHYSGYLQELLRLVSREAPEESWPRLACESAISCNVCGSRSFVPGPQRRMARGKPPQCLQCRSLERHRVLQSVLDAMKPREISGWSCLSIGDVLPAIRKRFARMHVVELSRLRTLGKSMPFDVVVGMNILSRSEEKPPFEDTLVALVSQLSERGVLILVDTMGKAVNEEALEYEALLRSYLPNVSVRSSWTADPVTGVPHVVSVASPDFSRTSEIALRLSKEAALR